MGATSTTRSPRRSAHDLWSRPNLSDRAPALQIASMQRTFDKCSSTPYLYSSSSKLFIACKRDNLNESYTVAEGGRAPTDDDEESIKIKGGYAGKNGASSSYLSPSIRH